MIFLLSHWSISKTWAPPKGYWGLGRKGLGCTTLCLPAFRRTPSSFHRPKDVWGCPAAPAEFSRTALLVLSLLFSRFPTCVCVCVCVRACVFLSTAFLALFLSCGCQRVCTCACCCCPPSPPRPKRLGPPAQRYCGPVGYRPAEGGNPCGRRRSTADHRRVTATRRQWADSLDPRHFFDVGFREPPPPPPRLSKLRAASRAGEPSVMPQSHACCTWHSLSSKVPSIDVQQDKSSGGSIDTTKTRSDSQRVRMCRGERPIGAAKGKQSNTMASCQPPPPPPQVFARYFKGGLKVESRVHPSGMGRGSGCCASPDRARFCAQTSTHEPRTRPSSR